MIGSNPAPSASLAVSTGVFSVEPIDLLIILLGAFSLLLGAIPALVFFLRFKQKNYLLLSFAAMGGIYGLRALLNVPAIQSFTGASSTLIPYGNALFSYSINIPVLLYFKQLFDAREPILRAFKFITIGFAPLGFAYDLFNGKPSSAMLFNNVLVIAYVTVAIYLLLRSPLARDKELSFLKIAFLVLAISVIHENLTSVGLLPSTVSVEPVGVAIFILLIGFDLQQRFFENQRQLLSVEQELQTAHRIQSAILPQQVPMLSGLRIAVRYRPMKALAGDFYDFSVFGDDDLAILVADVSGHGVPAALIASMAKMSFTFQCSSSRDPAQILEGLNRNLQETPPEQYLTAACAYFDSGRRTLVYSSAGHPPSLLLRAASRELVLCHSEAGIIGAFPSISAVGRQIAITGGDRLIIYTDGIVRYYLLDSSGTLCDHRVMLQFS